MEGRDMRSVTHSRIAWRTVGTLVLGIVMPLIFVPQASADVECTRTSRGDVCFGEDGDYTEDDGGGNGNGTDNNGRDSNPKQKSPWEEWQEEHDAWKTEIERIDRHNDDESRRYDEEYRNYQDCVANGGLSQDCVPPEAPDFEERPDEPGTDERWIIPPAPEVPKFTPPEAAWEVIRTKLRIPKIAAGIGPSPDANRWSMAVVQYPYWLWADGDTEASVEAEAGDLHVSLDAYVSGLVFDMGDGNTVECKGTGTVWVGSDHRDDRYPEPSPTCGYTWEKVSGAGKSYKVTVTTYWAVDWTAGGESGTEHLVDSTTRQVPVGELQSVVTGER